MVSLLDIGDLAETVPVRGKNIEVVGISAKGLLVLLQRFPEVRKLVASRGQDVKAEDLMKLGSDVVAVIIAAGCGKPGDRKFEDKAASLGAGEQLDLIAAIIKLTMPQGIGPFVEKLAGLAGVSLGEGAPGWGAAMKSPEQLNSASQEATRQS